MISFTEKFVFLALVFSIPFQKRVFLFGPSPQGEGFFEWGSGFLYFTDILVVFLLALWAKNVTRNVSSPWLWPMTLFAGLAFVSLTQAEFVDVGVYRFLKLAEFIFLFFYVATRVVTYVHDRKRMARAGAVSLHSVLWVLVASGVFQSVLAILQFAKQSSLGLEIFHESILVIGFKGVAEISVGGVEFIRAYGTFPSPNVLAGFLGICLLFVFYISLKVFMGGRSCSLAHSRQPSGWLRSSSCFAPDCGRGTMPKQPSNPRENKTVLPLIYGVVIFLLTFGLLLTFSRGVIIFFVFTSVLFFVAIFLLEKLKQYRKQAIKLAGLLVVSWLLLIAMLWPEVSARFLESSVSEPAIQERLFFNEVGVDTVSQNYPQLFFGVGIGNFVHHYMQSLPGLAPHLYQPVHNIFILIASEIGVFGLIVFILFLATLSQKAVKRLLEIQTIQNIHDREYFVYVFSLLLVACFLLLIALYDHYFWTLQQGSLMFWIVLGLLAGGTNAYNKRP